MKTFEKMAGIDVSAHTEKKGKFTYLSWPYAVAEFRKACPNGTWEIKHFDGQPYCKTDSGCFVEVTVVPDINSWTLAFSQVHPVLDHTHKTIKEPNAFQVNTSIQRCLVKAIALATGIGLYIYAGEDLPPGDEEKQKTSADWEIEVDNKCHTIEKLENWWKRNKKEIESSLTPAELDKFIQYCKRTKEILAEMKESNKVPEEDVPY